MSTDKFVLPGKEKRRLKITQEIRPYELRIIFLLDGRELGRIENKERLKEEFRWDKELKLPSGETLKVTGHLVGKTRTYVFDLFLDGKLLPGSNSAPVTYPIPIALVGIFHLLSGLTAGHFPTGGVFQATGSDKGSIVLGLVFLSLGALAGWRRMEQAFKTAALLVLLDGGFSVLAVAKGGVPPDRMPMGMISMSLIVILMVLPLHWFWKRSVSSRAV